MNWIYFNFLRYSIFVVFRKIEKLQFACINVAFPRPFEQFITWYSSIKYPQQRRMGENYFNFLRKRKRVFCRFIARRGKKKRYESGKNLGYSISVNTLVKRVRGESVQRISQYESGLWKMAEEYFQIKWTLRNGKMLVLIRHGNISEAED